MAIDSRSQLVYRHRLGEMEVSTGSHGLLFVFETAPGRDDDDRNIRRARAEAQLKVMQGVDAFTW